MAEPVSLLMLQFLAWLAHHPRSYAETMDAWRTSCPRLSVWEDALNEGFIQIEPGEGSRPGAVTLSPQGQAVLARSQASR